MSHRPITFGVWHELRPIAWHAPCIRLPNFVFVSLLRLQKIRENEIWQMSEILIFIIYIFIYVMKSIS